MNVVFYAANFDGFHAVLSRDAAWERPELCLSAGVSSGRRSLVLNTQW